MCKSCSHFACKVASMQRRMCGFSGILARGPNLPFVYFFEMEQASKPTPTRRDFSSSPSSPSTCLIVHTTRLHWTLFAFSRRRCCHRVAFLARRRTCVEVPPIQPRPLSAFAMVTYSSCPYQLCVMVKSHFNSTKLLLSSRSFHMLDNHPNTLHLPSHSEPGSAPLSILQATLIKDAFALDLCNGTECFDVCPKTLFVGQKSRNKIKRNLFQPVERGK